MTLLPNNRYQGVHASCKIAEFLGPLPFVPHIHCGETFTKALRRIEPKHRVPDGLDGIFTVLSTQNVEEVIVGGWEARNYGGANSGLVDLGTVLLEFINEIGHTVDLVVHILSLLHHDVAEGSLKVVQLRLRPFS